MGNRKSGRVPRLTYGGQDSSLTSDLALYIAAAFEHDPYLTTQDGTLMVSTLAKKCGCTTAVFYKSFKQNRLTAGLAKKICAMSKGAIKMSELADFL